MLQRIRGFLNDMRYINPRFTYLLHCNDLTSLMPFSQVSDHRDDDDDNDDIPVVSVNVYRS